MECLTPSVNDCGIFIFDHTHNSVWFNSVQEFTEIEACLVVTFFICLQNQLKSDSHVPEIFVKLKFSPGLFEKIRSFACLVFENENK